MSKASPRVRVWPWTIKRQVTRFPAVLKILVELVVIVWIRVKLMEIRCLLGFRAKTEDDGTM